MHHYFWTSMGQYIAEVRADRLYLQDGDTIKLNTKPWFDWLEVNHTFHYRIKDWTVFQVRKEQMGRGKFYWRMYHQNKGKQKRQHIGKSTRLTSKLLLSKAAGMVFSQTEIAFPSSEPELPDPMQTTMERVREQLNHDLKILQESYNNALDHLNAHAQTVGVEVDSTALLEKILREIDHKKQLNVENFRRDEIE